MTNGSLIRAKLTITSPTMSPESIVEIVSFPPDEIWREGDYVSKSLIRRQENGVSLSIAERVSHDIEPSVLELLDRIEPIRVALNRAARAFPIDYELAFAVYFVRPPSCHLSADTLRRLGELGAAFDLDLIPVDAAEF